MKKFIMVVLLALYSGIFDVSAQNQTQQVTAIQYFFNVDPGVGAAGNGAIVPVTPAAGINQIFNFTLPPSLSDGINQLYVRARDEFGQWSIAERSSFYVITTPVTQNIAAIQYYFDTDPGVGIPGNGSVIDVTPTPILNQNMAITIPETLSNDIHHLYIRTKDVSGRWSIAERNTFIVITPPVTRDIAAVQYYFDADPGTGVAGNGAIIDVTPAPTINQNIVITIPETLSNDYHNLFIRTKDVSGRWSIAEGSQFAVGECTNSASDSVRSWWSFDNVSAATVPDIAGNHDGICVNGTTTSLTAIFDGTDDYIGVPDNDSWAFGGDEFTLEFLANFSSPGGDMAHPGDKFIGQSEGPGDSKKWTFALGGGQLFFRLSDGATSQDLAAFPFAPTLNQWYHLALTRSADTLRTYINGQLSGMQVVNNLLIPNVNSALTIGWVDWVQGGDLGHMAGKLDEMTVHSRALLQQEISDISNSGLTGGKCKEFHITTPAISDAVYLLSFTQTLGSIFGTPPLTWSVAGGSLPDSVTLDANGVLHGTPSQAGEFAFTAQVVDAFNSMAQKDFVLKVLLSLPEPQIAIYKSGTSVVPGRDVDYFIIVANQGTVASSFNVVEFLEPWFKYVSSSPTAGILSSLPNVYSTDPAELVPSQIQWALELDAGESAVLSYRAKLNATFPLNEIVRGGPACPDYLEGACALGYAWCATNPPSPCRQESWDPDACRARLNQCEEGNANCMGDCGNDPSPTQGPVDPNEKIVMAEHYIKGDRQLPYVIHFENIGTIEALDVFVTDTLDEDLDETTLSIISSEGASFNPVTRVLKWDLININLLPDSSAFVLYTAKPKPDLPSGAVIKNRSYIQFEVFDIFATNETENIIDLSSPEGFMDALPDTMYQTSFPLSWSGTDTIGEIKRYSVFYAVDSGAYMLYVTNTKDTSVNFTGETGKSYQFICIAEDLAGNIEVQEPVAETSTRLNVICPDKFFRDADNDGYGNAFSTTRSCTQPMGYVIDSTDCNDANGNIHPGATELCNWLDDNCDGQVDENRLPVSVSVSASANPVVPGTAVTFSATPVNGGPTPSYQWQVDHANVPGATNSNYIYVPENNDSVACVMTSSETCTSGNPAISNTVIMTLNSSIPVNITDLQATVPGGMTVCYNATEVIIVAGSATSFIVEAGGSVTMIAGQRIVYHEGTLVEPGGYLHGYIAPGGPWCGVKSTSIVTSTDGGSMIYPDTERSFFSIYPNPTSGSFSLLLNGIFESNSTRVGIYGSHGELVLSANLDGTGKYDFSLAGKPVGIYFIRVITPDHAGTKKIIKQ